MADNITTSAAFATSSMKPAAAGGENIDAVWGRNIADCAGYSYFRKTPGPCFSSVITSGFSPHGIGTRSFNHRAEWPYMIGSYAIKGTCSGAVSFSVHGTLLLNGVQILATSFIVASSGNTLVSGSFVYDKTALVHNTDYKMVYKHWTDENDLSTILHTNMDVDTWQSATNP